MIQQYNEIQSNSGNKRKIDGIKKKIEKLNKELLSKCGRSKDKSFLFEVSLSTFNFVISIEFYSY